MSESGTEWHFLGMLVGWCITGIGFIASIVLYVIKGASWTTKASETDERHGKMLEDHEKRLRTVEANNSVLAEMRSDIKWIKDTLKRHHGA